MTDFDNRTNSGPAHVKMAWVTPQIELMLAQKTSAKFSNPREGGNPTEGFMGPSWHIKGNHAKIKYIRLINIG